MGISQELESFNYDIVSLIEKYLDIIKKRYAVNINFHDIEGIQYINSKIQIVLAQYLYHDNSFCNFIKKDDKCFNKCIIQKQKIYEKCLEKKTPFYGSCYMGIEEFVFPIFCEGILIGYFCIGQFSENMDKSILKLQKSSEKYGLSEDIYKDKFIGIMNTENIPLDDLICEMQMICKCMSLFYLKHGKNAISEIDNSDETNSYKENSIIQATKSFIKNNYNRELSLKILATNCYCNPTYLSYLFKNKLKINIMGYITAIRMEKAKHLLSITNMSITDVAMQVGYNDSGYFAKSFKHYSSYTPKEFRAKKTVL